MVGGGAAYLEDVVFVDGSIEDTEDGVDASLKLMRRQNRTQLGKTDQKAEHYRHLVKRLHKRKATDSEFINLETAATLKSIYIA